jgi:hypothetical protein
VAESTSYLSLTALIRSVVIDHLMNSQQSDEAVIYVFCDFRQPASTEIIRILRSLLAQLLPVYPGNVKNDFAELFDMQKQGKTPPSTLSRLAPLIYRAAGPYRRTFLVLDGLDECPNREPLLELLPSMMANGSFAIFLSSRIEQDIRDALSFADALSLRSEQSHIGSDIARHIEREVERRPQLTRLNAELKLKILETLSLNANGM